MNKFVSTVNGKKFGIEVTDSGNVIIDGNQVEYSLSKVSEYSYLLKLGNRVYDVVINSRNNENFWFLIDGRYIETTVRTTLQERANDLMKLKQQQVHHDLIKAPMPGLILKVIKTEGEFVRQGESIIILEAMKMENDLRAPVSGIIKELRVKEGEAVEKDTVLLTIE